MKSAMCYVDLPGYLRTMSRRDTLLDQEGAFVSTYKLFLVQYAMGLREPKETVPFQSVQNILGQKCYKLQGLNWY